MAKTNMDLSELLQKHDQEDYFGPLPKPFFSFSWSERSGGMSTD